PTPSFRIITAGTRLNLQQRCAAELFQCPQPDCLTNFTRKHRLPVLSSPLEPLQARNPAVPAKQYLICDGVGEVTLVKPSGHWFRCHRWNTRSLSLLDFGTCSGDRIAHTCTAVRVRLFLRSVL